MSKNKRAPKELQKYVVVVTESGPARTTQTFQYFYSQKDAKKWAKDKLGKKQLFKIDYDFYGDL